MKFIHILCVTSTLLLAACGDNDSTTPAGSGGSTNNGNNNSAGTGNTAEPSMASDEVSAAEGGEVALDDGAAVNIPAGALSDDAEVTIESSEPSNNLPDFDSIQGLAYEFGPDGTTFDVPVELTLPLVGTPGADEEAVVSWLNTDTNKWEDLETTSARGTVTAETTHFTLFVVRFKDVEAGSFDCSFEACEGGNIVGTWNIQGACIDVEFENPFEASCPESTFEIASNMSGTVTFNDDGTFSSSFTNGGDLNFSLPASCVVEMAMGREGDCQALFGTDSEESPTTCTGTQETGCECSQAGASETNENSGTYAVDGSSLTITDDEGTDPPSALCISGDTLKVQTIDEGGDGGTPATIVWAAERQ